VAKIERNALVSYSAEQMFALVNDIEAYPQYMDGCVGAKVLYRDDKTIEARLDLNKAGIQQSFTTRNELEPPLRMSMSLVEGPFSQFEGYWAFKPLTDAACKVSLVLGFEFRNKVLELAAGAWFESTASKQVDSLCQRARVIYGKV